MSVITFLAGNLIRGLVLGLVGVMGVLGFLMLCPFPSFWKEILSKGKGYAS